jgi:hypothetical protein
MELTQPRPSGRLCCPLVSLVSSLLDQIGGLKDIIISYVRTVIQSAETYESMRAKGIEFAAVDSCVAAIMKISCDKEINGEYY